MKTNKCIFCKKDDLNELDSGGLKLTKGIRAHYYCLLFSETIFQSGRDNQGILGFLHTDIIREYRKAKTRKCHYCGNTGANSGCSNKFCNIKFHLPCGLEKKTQHNFDKFTSFCHKHGKPSNIPPRIKKSIMSYSCVICLENFDSSVNLQNIIWADCCKAEILLHTTCIKRLALSAGYFTKCPGCNNKADFVKTIKLHGVFVPERDASWELTQNAYSELYYVHESCDAKVCQCPDGRTYKTERGKWKYFLCNLCGSYGTHQFCSQVKREFTCAICNSTAQEAEANVPNESNTVAETIPPVPTFPSNYTDQTNYDCSKTPTLLNEASKEEEEDDDDDIIVVDYYEDEDEVSKIPKSLEVLRYLSKDVTVTRKNHNSVTGIQQEQEPQVSIKKVAIKSTTKLPVAMKSTTQLPSPSKERAVAVKSTTKLSHVGSVDKSLKTEYTETISDIRVSNDFKEDENEVIVLDSDDEESNFDVFEVAEAPSDGLELFEPLAKLVKYEEIDLIPLHATAPPSMFYSSQIQRKKFSTSSNKTFLENDPLQERVQEDDLNTCHEDSSESIKKHMARENNMNAKNSWLNSENRFYDELQDISSNSVKDLSKNNEQSLHYHVPVTMEGEIEFVHAPNLSINAKVYPLNKQVNCSII